MENSKKKLREDMMKLWKETFHDSKEYVELIFDSYFSESFTPNIYKDGKLVAAMLAVPYEMAYKSGDEGVGSSIYKTLYLCGLATLPEYRRQGLMETLIGEILETATKRNFDLLFLIPADEHLRKYYSKFGFRDASPFCINMQQKSSNFSKFARIEYFESIDSLFGNSVKSEKGVIDSIFDFIHREEQYRKTGSVLHSKKDIKIAIEECFISGGRIYISFDTEERIDGIIFLYDKQPLEIYCVISVDENVRGELLNRVSTDFPNREIQVMDHCDPSDCENWKGDYRGMVRFLKNGECDEKINEILAGEISLMLD